MPGQQLQTSAFILSRQASGSDSFEQFTVFSAEHGLLLCLGRIAKGKSTASPIDLFDETEFALESSNQGRTWFIKEHRLIQRNEGIGRSYDALKVAADFATLICRNAVPDESREPITTLLRHTFAALAAGGRPDIVWLKAIYSFLRDEGYPVKQQWWPQLSATDRDAAAQLLNQPLAGQTADAPAVSRITRHLEHWLKTETEIRL